MTSFRKRYRLIVAISAAVPSSLMFAFAVVELEPLLALGGLFMGLAGGGASLLNWLLDHERLEAEGYRW